MFCQENKKKIAKKKMKKKHTAKGVAGDPSTCFEESVANLKKFVEMVGNPNEITDVLFKNKGITNTKLVTNAFKNMTYLAFWDANRLTLAGLNNIEHLVLTYVEGILTFLCLGILVSRQCRSLRHVTLIIKNTKSQFSHFWPELGENEINFNNMPDVNVTLTVIYEYSKRMELEPKTFVYHMLKNYFCRFTGVEIMLTKAVGHPFE